MRKVYYYVKGQFNGFPYTAVLDDAQGATNVINISDPNTWVTVKTRRD